MAVGKPQDVAAHLGRPLTSAETARAALLLVGAEAMIKARAGDLDGLDQALLVLVEAQAVARVLRNPDGAYQESLSGEFMQTRDRLGADGVLRIADDEWALLFPKSQSDAFAIRIMP